MDGERCSASEDRVTGIALTHVDRSGAVRMVDVGEKPVTERKAIARGEVQMSANTLALVKANAVAKGDVLTVAKIAGIMAAKKSAELIPLCHPISITHCDVKVSLNEERNVVEVEASVSCTAQTGVEMEALTAVAVACLTVYDMCKAVERGMTISNIRLEYKAGGRSGVYERA
ncbi:MAG TPA: cyclic pyranopterin monophosphate synthase MoaC [Firmicutes bacterium]|nr:cyclic pyranopterin monophosphate synthase MoaC [Bacillota bacterium]